MKADFALLFVLIAASFVAGVVGGIIGTRLVFQEALKRIELVSPVVVLDAAPALDSIQVRSTPEEIAAVLRQVNEQAERLKQKGFVVLRPNAVMAMPEAVHVTVGANTP